MLTKSVPKILQLVLIGAFLVFSNSCRKDGVEGIPVLSTVEVTEIGQTRAISGGIITSDGGFVITERGVCWSTSNNPTIADNKTSNGSGAGSFISELTGLPAGTVFYLRAYATNSKGTGYGSIMVFQTIIDKFTDPRDGKVYKAIPIGNQIWMSENLAYLPSVVGPSTDSQTTPYYYVYGYNGTIVNTAKAQANYTTYGVLYNWTAACASCPPGWHLPTDAEWTQLETYLSDNGFNYDGTTGGGGDKIAKAMASSSGWLNSVNSGNVGNTSYPEYRNKTGLTALPGGYKAIAEFRDIQGFGFWWSATETSGGIAYYRRLGYNSSGVGRNTFDKEIGMSVRCVKD